MLRFTTLQSQKLCHLLTAPTKDLLSRPKLEIRFVERGICPIAKSKMTELLWSDEISDLSIDG